MSRFGSRYQTRYPQPSVVPGVGTYEAEALALFARFTAAPTEARKRVINDLIRSMKGAGVWQKLDALYVMAAADAQAAQRNWKADQYNLTEISSPTFAVDRGYAGNGSSSYLTTGFVPSTAAGQYTLNSAHLGEWTRTNAGGTPDVGSRTAGGTQVSQLNPRSGTNQANFGLNSSTFATVDSITDSSGHTCISRLSGSEISLYKAGAAVGGPVASNTDALSALGLYIGAVNQAGSAAAFSTRQISAVHFGAGLSAAEASAVHASINAYLISVGAA